VGRNPLNDDSAILSEFEKTRDQNVNENEISVAQPRLL
jgi:hypothetical protein